jgi:SAM-dependent methyltransferase
MLLTTSRSSKSELKCILEEYKSISSNILLREVNSNVTYQSPVNFNESMKSPRHRWLPYKEGFSPSFVRSYLAKYGNFDTKNISVVDPFCGVGTTVIESAKMGYSGFGCDVSPYAVFAARTKSINLSKKEKQVFSNTIKAFRASKLKDVSPIPANATVNSYFRANDLEAILKAKNFTENISESKIADLFKLAYLSIIEQLSTHRKAGNGLKRKTRVIKRALGHSSVAIVKDEIVKQLELYANDIESDPLRSESEFVWGSCLEDEMFAGGQYNAVLTSPPYSNCFDYSKIYMCELWIGDFFKDAQSQKKFRNQSVRSHVHATWDARYEQYGSDTMNELIYPIIATKKLWSNKIGEMLKGYFMDIGKLLANLKDNLTEDAPVGFVVSNSCYGGIPIATDILLAEVAIKQGYRPEIIEVHRHMIPSSQQYVIASNKEYFRESLVVVRAKS